MNSKKLDNHHKKNTWIKTSFVIQKSFNLHFLLRWFKSWQEMLNAGVQDAFQQTADTYSHSLAIPTEMALHNKTFISYKVTNFVWSKHFVAFEATSTFKAEINGQNVTYIPNEESKTTSSIPIGEWPESSASDQQSNLLQGNYYLLQSTQPRSPDCNLAHSTPSSLFTTAALYSSAKQTWRSWCCVSVR